MTRPRLIGEGHCLPPCSRGTHMGEGYGPKWSPWGGGPPVGCRYECDQAHPCPSGGHGATFDVALTARIS